ncbi:MAG: 2-C-methyl-D-erythritol 2,4-cyclodiphosphate synthase [Patescibacteria group bacterium]
MTTAIILAAGKSERFKKRLGGSAKKRGGNDKLFLQLNGRPVLWHAIRAFEVNSDIAEIIVVANSASKKNVAVLAKEFRKVSSVVLGGASRQESVRAALGRVSPRCKVVVVHNGANPLVAQTDISRCVESLRKRKEIAGVGVGRKVTDTMRRVSGSQTGVLDRTKLWQMETPQAARFSLFRAAHEYAKEQKITATDDLALLELIGKKVAVIPSSPQNFKITTANDLARAKATIGDFLDAVRVGYGEDSHRFDTSSRGLVLGGVRIPSMPKLHANSDGDVVLHALAAAISQACGGGSLGTFATPIFKKGIEKSSAYVADLLRKHRPQILNVGITIEGARPKIDPVAPKIRTFLSKLLSVAPDRIGITAHTGEGLTAFGRGEGLRCVAVISCILDK